jgi:alpha-tubulin suppressor-like RCC1 family protein
MTTFVRSPERGGEDTHNDSKDLLLAPFSDVACGKFNSLLLLNGRVFSVGDDRFGISGIMGLQKEKVGVPKLINWFGRNWIMIQGVACGDFHCLAYSDKGKLYSWGRAVDGALGYSLSENEQFKTEPMQVHALEQVDICQVCCGKTHSLVLTTCGKVFNWGQGDKEMKSQSNCSEPWNVFEFMEHPEDFIQVAAGQTHNAALTASGDVYTWGDQSEFCQARPFIQDQS